MTVVLRAAVGRRARLSGTDAQQDTIVRAPCADGAMMRESQST